MNYGAASQTAKMSGFLVKVLRLDSRIERGNLEHAARPGLCSSLDPADVFLSDVFVFMFETNIDLKLCLVQTAVFASKTFGPRGLPESGMLDGLAVLAGPVLGVEVTEISRQCYAGGGLEAAVVFGRGIQCGREEGAKCKVPSVF